MFLDLKASFSKNSFKYPHNLFSTSQSAFTHDSTTTIFHVNELLQKYIITYLWRQCASISLILSCYCVNDFLLFDSNSVAVLCVSQKTIFAFLLSRALRTELRQTSTKTNEFAVLKKYGKFYLTLRPCRVTKANKIS